MTPLASTVVFISAMAFIIELIIIYLVTSMIVEKNKSTISLMKIFGYRKKEVSSLILNIRRLSSWLGSSLGYRSVLH
ncbi:FtsX-like permease family protein [Paenibacillus ottowii]